MKLIKLICLGILLCPDLAAQNTLQQLDFLIGNWEVGAEKRLSGAGPWDTSIAKSAITKTLKATVIEINQNGTLEGKPFIIKVLLAANKNSGKYQMVFMDSEHANFVDYEGDAIGDSIVFDKLFVYPNKNTVKLRWVFKKISADEFTMESMRMPESATVWDITTKYRYKKIKSF